MVLASTTDDLPPTGVPPELRKSGVLYGGYSVATTLNVGKVNSALPNLKKINDKVLGIRNESDLLGIEGGKASLHAPHWLMGYSFSEMEFECIKSVILGAQDIRQSTSLGSKCGSVLMKRYDKPYTACTWPYSQRRRPVLKISTLVG